VNNFQNRKKILSELIDNIDENKLSEILNTEEYKLYNAMITAEGAIKVALENCELGIALTKVILIGYGRIGKALSKMLIGMNANLTIIENDKIQVMNAKILGYKVFLSYEFNNENLKNANIIFNTAEDYNFPETNATIINLATTKLNAKEEKSKKVIHANALPEKNWN